MSTDISAEFDADLTAAERALLNRAREFGSTFIAVHAAQWERERRHPTEALVAACRAGLASIELPVEFGGHGLRFSAKMRIAEELSKSDFAFAFSLINHHNATERIARAERSLAERLVPRMLAGDLIGCAAYTEPGHGSDLGQLNTSAEKVDGGWRLNGAKAWITNAAVAGVVLTLAQTDPAAGGRGVALFAVETDRAGFLREPAYELMGAHAIGAAGFRLVDYFVPQEGLLSAPGSAFKQSLAGINGARCYVAAMCAGMLDSALELATRYATQRKAFGQAIVEFQGLRWSLVDAATDLAALRLLAYRAARQIEAGQDAEEACAAAKKFAGERTLAHLAACVQAMGAEGLRSDHPLMRHLVSAKTAAFTDGTTQIMNERLGKWLLRRYNGA